MENAGSRSPGRELRRKINKNFKKAEAYSINNRSGAGQEVKSRKIALHPRMRPGEQWRGAQGGLRPLSNTRPNINLTGIPELRAQKEFPMTRF